MSTNKNIFKLSKYIMPFFVNYFYAFIWRLACTQKSVILKLGRVSISGMITQRKSSRLWPAFSIMGANLIKMDFLPGPKCNKLGFFVVNRGKTRSFQFKVANYSGLFGRMVDWSPEPTVRVGLKTQQQQFKSSLVSCFCWKWHQLLTSFLDMSTITKTTMHVAINDIFHHYCFTTLQQEFLWPRKRSFVVIR